VRISSKTLILATVAACTALLVSGCSQTSSSSEHASAAASATPSPTYAMSTAEKSELANGTVTYDEYKAAFRRYQACDAKAGYKLLIGGETNEVINYSVPAAAVDSGVDDRCIHTQFWDVDTKWQLARADTSPQSADYSKCLEAAGITPKSTETEKFHQLQQAHIDPTQCYINNGVLPSPSAGGSD
jgi:hypothetical protein